MRSLSSFEYYFRARVERREGEFGINVAVCAPFESHPNHRHEKSGLLVLLQGDYIEDNGFGEVTLRSLTGRFRPAGTIHSHRTGSRGATALHIEFPEDWSVLPSTWKEVIYGGSLILAKQSIRSVLDLAQAPDVPIEEIESASLCLLEEMISPQHCDRPNLKWLSYAKELLDSSSQQKVNLKRIANEVAISPMHLAASFRKQYGMSVIEYTTQRRIATATTLILEGMPVGQAAIEAGFYDNAYFSKLFRHTFGFRPSDLRHLAHDCISVRSYKHATLSNETMGS